MKEKRKAKYTTKRLWRRTPISKATNLREVAAFWDKHDIFEFTEHPLDVTDQVHVDIRRVRRYIEIEPKTLDRASRVAHQRGLSTEKLINQWVREAVSRA